MHPYILYITLLKKICTLHAIGIVCGGAYFLNKVIHVYPKIDIEVHIFLIKL